MVDLIFGQDYRPPSTQELKLTDDEEGLTVLARAISGGNSKTEGYHERRVRVSRSLRKRLIGYDTDPLAALAKERVQAIAKIRTVLWGALASLFDNGSPKDRFSDSAKDKASEFASPFEQGEDSRFFDGPLGLNAEVEAEDPDLVRLAWYPSMAKNAENILLNAFDAGPRSAEQRYRARSAALARLHGGLCSDKVLPSLAEYYRDRKTHKETVHDPA